PTSNWLVAVPCSVRLPAIVSRPAELPGAMTPPTVTLGAVKVPVPLILPVPTSSGLAEEKLPPAAFRVPVLVKLLPNARVPALDRTVPLLLKVASIFETPEPAVLARVPLLLRTRRVPP